MAVAKGGLGFKVEVSVEVSRQTIEDIITTAVEGGINYWAVGTQRPSVWREEESSTEGPRRWFDIGYAVRRGLPLAVAEGYVGLPVDAGDVDADQADVIVQLGVFGEVVYS